MQETNGRETSEHKAWYWINNNLVTCTNSYDPKFYSDESSFIAIHRALTVWNYRQV